MRNLHMEITLIFANFREAFRMLIVSFICKMVMVVLIGSCVYVLYIDLSRQPEQQVLHLVVLNFSKGSVCI